MSVIHTGYEIDTEHVADVLEALATEIRDNNAHVTYASDGYEIEPDEATEYQMELDFVFTDQSGFPHHFFDDTN